MRLLLFSSWLAALAACTQPLSRDPFVLNIALPGTILVSNGPPVDGYATIIEDWVYEPLVRISDEGAMVPSLARSFERLQDGGYRIRLRPGSTFSDGSPVTINDVARSASDHDLRVEVGQDEATLESTVAGVPVDSILPTIFVSKREGNLRLGSGPFRIAEMDANHILVQRRAPIKGRLNTVRLTAYDSPREALARVLRGDANVLPQIEAREVEFFEGVGHLRVVRALAPHAVALVLNSSHLSQTERLEIAKAMPIAELSNAAFGDSCRPWPRGSKGGPTMAGRPLKIVTRSSDEEMSKLGLAVRRALGARGGDLARANNDESVRILTEGDFDIAVLTPLIWPIGMASLIFHSGSQRNILHLDSPAVDAALESGNWVHVLDALDRDPALVFVCTRDRIAIIDSRVKNARLGPWGMFETLPEWEVGE